MLWDVSVTKLVLTIYALFILMHNAWPHDGIQGNEHADVEAKMAVSHGSSHVTDLPQVLQDCELPHSLTAVVGAFKQDLNLCQHMLE